MMMSPKMKAAMAKMESAMEEMKAGMMMDEKEMPKEMSKGHEKKMVKRYTK